MRPEELTRVRALGFFSKIDQASFNDLMHGSYLQHFPPQVQLITEGDPPDFLHIVIEGCVELFAGANNRETSMALVRPFSTFILAAVLSDAPYLMSARTVEKSRVLMISSENVRKILLRDATFARAIVQELAQCYRSVIKSLKDHKLRTGVERLANYLLGQRDRQGNVNMVTLPVDKRTLAALLGMTPENLSRAFATLGPYGVNVKGRKIELTNIEDLEVLAKPTPLIDDQTI